MKNTESYIVAFVCMGLVVAVGVPVLPSTVRADDNRIPAVRLDENLTRTTLGMYIEYFEDESGRLSFDAIRGETHRKAWKRAESDMLAFGFTESAYWVRFTVENPTPETVSFYLEQAYPLIDRISFYYPRDGGYAVIEAGDLRPFHERPFKHKNFVFPLSVPAESSAEYYIHQQTGSSMQFNLTLWSIDSFRDDSYTDYYILMLFYGVSLVMMLYNLVIFFFIRHRDYLYYALNILMLLLFTSAQNGIAFQFLWPDYPRWANFCLPPFIALYLVFGNGFILSALDCKERTPLLHRLGIAVIAVCMFAFVLSIFLEYHLAIVLTAGLGLLTCNYVFWLVLINALRKSRIARFFLLALIFFISLAAIWLLMLFGILPSNPLTNWAHYAGAVITETLFAIALADRINVMRIELQVLNTGLEDRVSERTRELQFAMEKLATTNTQLTQTRDALWGEMALAKKIQTVLLPEAPRIPGYDISVYMNPMDEVGGDYYDVINIGGYDWVVIGDVSGHGVPAGLVMMMVQTAINVTLVGNPEMAPSELLTVINRTIAKNIRQLGGEKYMTITVLAAHKNGAVHYSGLHQDILVYRAKTRKVESIETDGTWIGILDDIDGLLSDDTFFVEEGDAFLLYTDGITEAVQETQTAEGERTRAREMFGDEKLAGCFERLGPLSTDEIRDGLLRELDGYRCLDDVTLVVIKKGRDAAVESRERGGSEYESIRPEACN